MGGGHFIQDDEVVEAPVKDGTPAKELKIFNFFNFITESAQPEPTTGLKQRLGTDAVPGRAGHLSDLFQREVLSPISEYHGETCATAIGNRRLVAKGNLAKAQNSL